MIIVKILRTLVLKITSTKRFQRTVLYANSNSIMTLPGKNFNVIYISHFSSAVTCLWIFKFTINYVSICLNILNGCVSIFVQRVRILHNMEAFYTICKLNIVLPEGLRSVQDLLFSFTISCIWNKILDASITILFGKMTRFGTFLRVLFL